MFNEVVLEKELENFLKELDISYAEYEDLLIVDSCHFASALIYRATKAGAKVI